jgi:hypothetical protein
MRRTKSEPTSRVMKPTVVVEISGGICQSVYATVPVEIVVRDFDNIRTGDPDPLKGANLDRSRKYLKMA